MTQLAPVEVTLGRLFPNRNLPFLYASIPVKNLQIDSRKIETGSVFVALKAWGCGADGDQFIADAIAAGAAAVLFESDEESLCESENVVKIGVKNLAQKLSEIAGYFYGSPSLQVPVIAITGTNGKTTCAQLLAQLFSLQGKNVGIIGTLGAGIWSANDDAAILEKTGFTTPDAVTTQAVIHQLVQRRADLINIEVSSHALTQFRVAAVNIDTAILTNLSRDHLDFHGDMQAYADAKAQLFQFSSLQTAIVNIDDDFGRELQCQLTDKSYRLLTYSVQDSSADISVSQVNYDNWGMRAKIQTPWGDGELCSGLIGAFNLSNMLAVITAACIQGLEFETVLSLLPQLKSTAGRMQTVRIAAEQDVAVVIDFAHTPDALKNTLQALRAQAAGKIVCVFGCGGDRDVGKRPLMGSVAIELADRVILTSDNPRSENPERIVDDIIKGIAKGVDENIIGEAVVDEDVADEDIVGEGNVGKLNKKSSQILVELDRAQAIFIAITKARAGDTVLIAGKGHETEQIFSDRSEYFSDSEQAESALNLRFGGAAL